MSLYETAVGYLSQINKAHAAALQEEPNCFDYDSFYDTIQESRKEAELASFQQEQGGPRYLTAMISARDRRHRIQDMAYNRREALAAQAEDGLYEGKEKFATVAYKKKLEEDRLFAEHLAAQYAPAQNQGCSLLLMPSPVWEAGLCGSTAHAGSLQSR
jgi:hypothetical protein